MEIAQGVHLHLIENEKFKTNHVTFRFSGVFNRKTVARRVLVAQILTTANAAYPTAQKFRERLANLYGASLSTKVSTKGLVHIVDIDLVFAKDRYVLTRESLLEEMLVFLREVLFSPPISVAQYQSKIFELEQSNLINYLKADKEDSFYKSELELKNLFYENETLQISKYSQVDLVQAENSYTAYQEFQKMLNEDQIDIFLYGEFNDYRMIQLFNTWPLENRHPNLNFSYKQDYRNITREKIEKKEVSQSVLGIAYHVPISYNEESYFALLVFNGLFGAYAHSLLFTEVREKEGLAYTIGSQLDIYTGLLHVYAGIDRKDRNKVLQLINKQIGNIRVGRFSSKNLNQTKKMLKASKFLSLDNAKVAIEQHYNEAHLKQSYTLTEWIDKVDKVCKDDLIKLATQIKLQALYFLEGE